MNPEAWLDSARVRDTDFPLENLPYGAFATLQGAVHLGVAIGDRILDLHEAAQAGLLAGLSEPLQSACCQPTLNVLMGLDPIVVHELRVLLQGLLASTDAAEREHVSHVLVAQSGAQMVLPVAIGDYTDFYASLHHATNVGRLFRPSNPLLPNYKYVPVGYHGRSSSIVASPQPVRRPNGQRPGPDGQPPGFGPSRQLDYELEVGFYVGAGNRLGEPVPLSQADEHIFGACLLNDWSARDIQRWEYQPLGPFLGKNFATSISPWVVPREALAPFRVPRAARQEGDPKPLAYLDGEADRRSGAYEVILEVWLQTARMHADHVAPIRLSRGQLSDLYWTPGQMLAHHTSNGCNLRGGDLFGTGTVSGPEPEARGCLLELTSGGKLPVPLPGGETRAFLEDGDEITFRAWCQRPGMARIGFGACTGRIEAAHHL